MDPPDSARRDTTRLLMLALVLWGLGLFLWSRVIGLEQHPVYFFCDEAIHGVEAEAIAATGRDRLGSPAPVYFRGLGNYTLSLSVWLAAPVVGILGKSIFSVRLVGVLLTTLAVVLLLPVARGFGIRNTWLLPLVCLPIGSFFLMGRTGFEYSSFVATFAAGLLGLTLAFTRDSRFLVLSGIAFGLFSYSYLPARGISPVVTAALFGAFAYRRRPPKSILLGSIGAYLAVLAPAILYTISWPERAFYRLSSQQFQGDSMERLLHMFDNLWRFFSYDHLLGVPPNPSQMRHYIPDHGHFPLWFAPLIVVALVVLALEIQRSRRVAVTSEDEARVLLPVDRLLILLILVATAPATIAVARAISLRRGYTLFFPVVLLTTMGLDCCLRALPKQGRGWPSGLRGLCVGLVVVSLSVYGIHFTRSYLQKDGLHISDYGLYGLQYGAPQLFESIAADLASDSPARFHVVTPFLFDAPGIFPVFFLAPKDRSKVRVAPFWEFARSKPAAVPGSRFYVLQSNFRRAQRNQPNWCHVETIRNPDGSPQLHVIEAPGQIRTCPDGASPLSETSPS